MLSPEPILQAMESGFGPIKKLLMRLDQNNPDFAAFGGRASLVSHPDQASAVILAAAKGVAK